MKAAARADLDYAESLRIGVASDHWNTQADLHEARIKAIDDLIGRMNAL
jgi:hypothetical protein